MYSSGSFSGISQSCSPLAIALSSLFCLRPAAHKVPTGKGKKVTFQPDSETISFSISDEKYVNMCTTLALFTHICSRPLTQWVC